MCVCVYVCMCVCISLSIYNMCIYIYIYIYTHGRPAARRSLSPTRLLGPAGAWGVAWRRRKNDRGPCTYIYIYIYIYILSTEATLGRGDLSVCPLWGLCGGPWAAYFWLEGCPLGVPTGTNTKGTSPEGRFCASPTKGRRLRTAAADESPME